MLVFKTHDEAVDHMLATVSAALSPPGMAAFLHTSVDPYLRTRAEERFTKEGDSAVGGKWKPLAPATVTIRQNLGYGGAHPINHRTGELERYITGEEANVLVHPWGASAELPGRAASGDLEDKLKTAQQGGISDMGRPVPARPVLALDVRDTAAVLLLLGGFVEKRAAAAGFAVV